MKTFVATVILNAKSKEHALDILADLEMYLQVQGIKEVK